MRQRDFIQRSQTNEFYIAKGYLKGLSDGRSENLQGLKDERAKAKGLVEALESIVSHQKFVGGRLSDISTIKLLAERALARYKGKE